MPHRMRTSSFTVVEIGTRPPQRARISTKKYKESSAFAVKIGICALACVMMLASKQFDISPSSELVESVSAALDDDTDLSKILGKLQFVELPGAVEVFSSDDTLISPVSADSSAQIYLMDEAEYAEWTGIKNAGVVACSSGEVRAIGEHEFLGNYVRIQHSEELETIYYGLETINVEQGQPVKKQDTLGTLGDDGILRLSVLLNGKPGAPADYFKSLKAE